jgi:hypothetical protein
MEKVLKFRVKGTKFRHANHLMAAAVEGGDELCLEREPTNEHDPDAVRVMLADGTHIGYVQADMARMVGEILVTADVLSVRATETWHCEVRFQPGACAGLELLPEEKSLKHARGYFDDLS